MMCSAAWSASCPVALPCHARSAVWHHPVGSSRTVAVFCEWSTGTTLHCIHLSAHLTYHDGAACLHVLQAIMV
jgi:hypothetical protein